MMVVVYSIVVLAGFLAGASASVYKPDVIHLPTGFFPEGIEIGDDWDVYVGSIGDLDGRIWKGDLKTGKGEVVVPEVGSSAVGLSFDKRSKYLYVCGGSQGTLRIYDDNFDLVADVPLGLADGSSFVNDVILTKEAAYMTDTTQPQYYKLPLDKKTGQLESMKAETIGLSDGFIFVDGTFNSNGIVASDDGQTLIIVNMATGVLYKVDATTGRATPIDLGDSTVTSGDGLVLRGNTLWVVQNGLFGDVAQISEISLSADFSCGSMSPRVLKHELFDFPATAARKNNGLYTVSSKFAVAAEDVPTTEYEIIRVDRDGSAFTCSPEV